MQALVETEMKKMKHFFTLACSLLLGSLSLSAQKVDYSVVSVPEESGTEFTRITTPNDYVCMPLVKRSSNGVQWFSNRVLGVSKDGKNIAYLSQRNNTTNIFIKELGKQGGAVQRTNRSGVVDFSYSPDGKYICFSEQRGKVCQILQTDATTGYVCRQITNASSDYTPVYTSDMENILFARQEGRTISIWGHNIKNNFLSSYSTGMNPCPIPGESAFLCSRSNSSGQYEIWKVNYATGVEECIVSNPIVSYTTPIISPNGKWILFVGGSLIADGNVRYYNTDIYVCRLDGSELAQLTYHAADDLSPVWSKDGNYIYFISQRGDANATANIWRMSFNY